MFDQLNGMPLHPLIIHAPVIGIPLAFLLAVLFAFPRTRAWARWPLLVTVLGATAATFAARESGKALFARLDLPAESPVLSLLRTHEALANQLFYIMLGYAVITVAAVFLVSACRRENRGGSEPDQVKPGSAGSGHAAAPARGCRRRSGLDGKGGGHRCPRGLEPEQHGTLPLLDGLFSQNPPPERGVAAGHA